MQTLNINQIEDQAGADIMMKIKKIKRVNTTRKKIKLYGNSINISPILNRFWRWHLMEHDAYLNKVE